MSSFSFAQNVGIGTSTPDEKLQVDCVIRIGKNQTIALESSRQNLVKFGDGNFVTVGEQDKDDRLVLKASSFTFKNGKVDIGVDSVKDILDINGALIINNTNNNNKGGICRLRL